MQETLRTWWTKERQTIEAQLQSKTRKDLGSNAITVGKFVELLEIILQRVSGNLHAQRHSEKLPYFDKYKPNQWYKAYLNNKYGDKEFNETRRQEFDLWKNTKELKDIYENRHKFAHINPTHESQHEQIEKQKRFIHKCDQIVELLYNDKTLAQHINVVCQETTFLTQSDGLIYMGYGLTEVIHNTVSSPGEGLRIIELLTNEYRRVVIQHYPSLETELSSLELIELLDTLDKAFGHKQRLELDYKRFLEKHFDYFKFSMKIFHKDYPKLKENWSNQRSKMIKVQHIQESEDLYLTVLHLQMGEKHPVIMDISLKRGAFNRLLSIPCPEAQTWLTERYPLQKRQDFTLTQQCTLLFEHLKKHCMAFQSDYMNQNGVLLLEIPEFDDRLSLLPWNENLLRKRIAPLHRKYTFKNITSIVDAGWFEQLDLSTEAQPIPSTLEPSTAHCILYPYETEEELDKHYDDSATVFWTQRGTPSMNDIIEQYYVDLGIIVFACPLNDDLMGDFTSATHPIELLQKIGDHNRNKPKEYIATTVSFREWQTEYTQTSTMSIQ